ncbi:MAG: ribonuclease HI family protein [Patescibacteria group bacterium]
MKLIVHTDGGSRGNPGQAAIGIVIQMIDESSKKSETKVIEFGKRIGEATNNVAEYTAVREALAYMHNNLLRSGISHRETIIQFFLDSLLVVQQLNGVFKIKDARLREIFFAIKSLEQELDGVISYTHIPREENMRADALVNKALDAPM